MISVIIPFYNARDYITKSVESALDQPETGEVILIEDGSPDGGLVVCQYLASKYPKVKLLQHKDKGNHGVSASRNLGIINSSYPLIAFLDADDYFLTNRFKHTIEVLAANKDADGVYEAIGSTLQNEDLKEFWSKLPFNDVTTVTKIIEPDNLFEVLMSGQSGYFSIDGLTVRKELLEKAGYFKADLSFMEDTHLILKLCALGKLYPGNIAEPVSMRRVHDKNRITYHVTMKREIYQSHLKVWFDLYKWGKVNLSKERENLVVFHCLDRIRKSDYFDDFRWSDFWTARLKMLGLVKEFPKLLTIKLFWRMMLPSSECFKAQEIKRLNL